MAIFNEKVPDRPNFAGKITTSWWIPSSRCDTKPWKWESTVHIVLYVLHILANHPKNDMFLFHNSEPYQSCHRVVSIRKGSFRFTPRKPRSQASPQWRVPKPFHLSHRKRQQLEASSEHFLGWPISFVWTFIGFSWKEWWFTLKIVFVPLISDTPRHCSQMFLCLGQALGFLWCQNSGQRLRHHSGRVTANFPTSISFTKAVYAPCVLYIYPTRVIFWVQKWLGNYHLPAPSSIGKYAVRNCPIGFLRSDRPEPPVVTRRKRLTLLKFLNNFGARIDPKVGGVQELERLRFIPEKVSLVRSVESVELRNKDLGL